MTAIVEEKTTNWVLPTRPLLSATIETEADLQKLTYPLAVSPKLDGIRCLIHPSLGPVSRSFKAIPNNWIRETLNQPALHGLDGELCVIKDGKPDWAATASGVMSRDGDPDFMLYVFDHFLQSKLSYVDRQAHAINVVMAHNHLPVHITFLQHELVSSAEMVLAFEEQYLSQGYEGIMLRSLSGQYKSGRSTLKQQTLMKMKRFLDDEATIIGFEHLERNMNPQERDAFGLAERSDHKANKVADELLGKLVVQNERWGEFRIGSGFDVTTRQHIWDNQPQYLGKKVTFKYLPHGIKDKPRHPIYLRMRPNE
jgi:DNA ligase-1